MDRLRAVASPTRASHLSVKLLCNSRVSCTRARACTRTRPLVLATRRAWQTRAWTSACAAPPRDVIFCPHHRIRQISKPIIHGNVMLPRFKRDAVIFDALLLLYDERVSHEESVSQTIRPLALPFGDDLILVVSCSKILARSLRASVHRV